jgi:hypothetical protein
MGKGAAMLVFAESNAAHNTRQETGFIFLSKEIRYWLVVNVINLSSSWFQCNALQPEKTSGVIQSEAMNLCWGE